MIEKLNLLVKKKTKKNIYKIYYKKILIYVLFLFIE